MSTIGLCGVQMNDESHLPMTEQSLLAYALSCDRTL